MNPLLSSLTIQREQHSLPVREIFSVRRCQLDLRESSTSAAHPLQACTPNRSWTSCSGWTVSLLLRQSLTGSAPSVTRHWARPVFRDASTSANVGQPLSTCRRSRLIVPCGRTIFSCGTFLPLTLPKRDVTPMKNNVPSKQATEGFWPTLRPKLQPWRCCLLLRNDASNSPNPY